MNDIPASAGIGKTSAGHFCWIDLAATDAASAKAFYGGLFGWTAQEQQLLGGSITRLRSSAGDVGSLYQLSRTLCDQGVPSHWTSYIQVANLDDALRHACALGGKALVPPLVMPGIARVALIVDPVGAQIGLWEPIETTAESRHG